MDADFLAKSGHRLGPALAGDELPVVEPAPPVLAFRREQVTALLMACAAGTRADAYDRLMPIVYDELRAVAERQLRREGVGHTLGPTALVHEAYLRLVDQSRAQWVNRAHFFSVAARIMRRLLVDHARRRLAEKRGGGVHAMDLDAAEIPVEEEAESLLALHDALERLERMSPRLAAVVECRFFGGMTETETASALDVTDRTVRRDWIKAKGWLHQQLAGSHE
jgi:RNA polymerase sigma factor (TIGR02999 family)